MSLYNSEHPYSNGLEILLDERSGDWPILFALVCERLQRIELDMAAVQMDLSAAQREIAVLKAAPTGVIQSDDSLSSASCPF